MRSRPYFADDLDPAGRIGAERVGMQDRDAAQQADICRRDGTEIHVPEAGYKLGLTQGGGRGRGSPYQRIAASATRRKFRMRFALFSRVLKNLSINAGWE